MIITADSLKFFTIYHINNVPGKYTQGKPKKVQHESYDVSEMREYFCTKFCSFVYKTTVHKFAALCSIYLTYDQLTETQTPRANFAKYRLYKRLILLLMLSSAQYHLCCDGM